MVYLFGVLHEAFDDWRDCPEQLEVIELSKLLEDVEGIALSVRESRKVTG